MVQGQIPGEEAGYVSPGISILSPVHAFRDPLPSLPIMTTTRLQLELLLGDSVVDLKGVTEVILGDAGATLQILRLIGEEYPNEEDRPRRIEDCIVSLSMARCYQTICASNCGHAGSYVAEWQHCRRIAECARELARGMEDFPPEEAYLVGLLYRLGRFPQLLGWEIERTSPMEDEALGVMLAFHWNLPGYVVSAIKERQEAAGLSRWDKILGMADELACQPIDEAA
jgi:c-di-GMP-related signal transduction protein